MVPRRGLEPPRLAAPVPETGASTNSAIWALAAQIRAELPPCQSKACARRFTGPAGPEIAEFLVRAGAVQWRKRGVSRYKARGRITPSNARPEKPAKAQET